MWLIIVMLIELLRIEIQSTLTMCSSVRSKEIETIDPIFALTCANKLGMLYVYIRIQYN